MGGARVPNPACGPFLLYASIGEYWPVYIKITRVIKRRVSDKVRTKFVVRVKKRKIYMKFVYLRKKNKKKQNVIKVFVRACNSTWEKQYVRACVFLMGQAGIHWHKAHVGFAAGARLTASFFPWCKCENEAVKIPSDVTREKERDAPRAGGKRSIRGVTRFSQQRKERKTRDSSSSQWRRATANVARIYTWSFFFNLNFLFFFCARYNYNIRMTKEI